MYFSVGLYILNTNWHFRKIWCRVTTRHVPLCGMVEDGKLFTNEGKSAVNTPRAFCARGVSCGVLREGKPPAPAPAPRRAREGTAAALDASRPHGRTTQPDCRAGAPCKGAGAGAGAGGLRGLGVRWVGCARDWVCGGLF